MQEITLRKGTVEDGDLLLKIEQSVSSKYFRPCDTEEHATKYLKDDYVFFIVLNNKEIGTVSYERKEDGSIYFNGLTVLTEFNGRGYASFALKLALEGLKNEKSLNLVVHPENTAAIIIYLKAEFVIKEWKEDYFGDGEPRLFLVFFNEIS